MSNSQNLGGVLASLKYQISETSDPHAIERRFSELLTRISNDVEYKSLLSDLLKIAGKYGVPINRRRLNEDLSRLNSNETDEVRMEWSRGFWSYRKLRPSEIAAELGKRGGRPKRYKDEQEKINFHNAKRKKGNAGLSDEQILAKLRNK